MTGSWKRPAVVSNPSKHDDHEAAQRAVVAALVAAGLPAPLWYDTTAEDPGRGQTTQAVSDGADLVLACGGDGTVRACAAALTGGDVPLGLLPAGTGNLLARNLDIPTDLGEAAEVAAAGNLRRIDVPVLDGEPFVVMGGSGFDAQLIEFSSDRLKSRIGWAAYAIAGARAVRSAEPATVWLHVDGQVEIVSCVGVIVGNVGTLTGGMVLLPGAEPDDGQLDVAVLTPVRAYHWLGLGVRIAAGRRPKPWHLKHYRGRHIVVEWPSKVAVEIDGDLLDPSTRLDFTIKRSALAVCVPAS